MKLSTVVFMLILALLTLFSVLNWSVIMAPTEISLLFASIRAPLGLLLLALIVLLTVIYLGFLVYLQTSVLLETRRHARELGAQRDLADKAEASRFTDLRTFLEREIDSLGERADRHEQELKGAFEQSANTLAAYIGELEDRLERGGHIRPDPAS
ncbi:MAG: LapA family protein [Burkholderiales bacterium]